MLACIIVQMTNQEKGLIEELRTKARKKSQKCYNTLCNEMAIRSHLQQAEESIRCISSAGKIIQLEDLNPHFENSPYGFKEKGIIQKGDVLTFWGFCNKCDSQIFKSIETNEIDYSLHRNQLLYSYRGFLNEHYKQEYNVKWYELIFESNLNDSIKEFYEKLFIQFTVCVKAGNYVKELFESDLLENSQNFKFITLKLPKIEVCTSATFAKPRMITVDWSAIQMQNSIAPITNYNFINLIPTNENLYVIFGHIADESLPGNLDLEKILNLSQKEQIKLISDILIKHIETWIVSPSLHNKWKQRKIDKEILQQKKIFRPIPMRNKYLKFNMFHDLF